MSKDTPTPARPALDASELADTIERRKPCVYRDGWHYVPLFVPGGGSEVDELTPALAALRSLADMRGALEGIADHAHEQIADTCAEYQQSPGTAWSEKDKAAVAKWGAVLSALARCAP